MASAIVSLLAMGKCGFMSKAIIYFWMLHTVGAVYMLAINKGQERVILLAGRKAAVEPGASWSNATLKVGSKVQAKIKGSSKVYKFTAPAGRYAVLFIGADSEITMHDNNAVQLELSAAAHRCYAEGKRDAPDWQDCLALQAFEGAPRKFAERSWNDLWANYEYWHLCNVREPDRTIRSQMTKDNLRVDILRESPLVATVRGFVSASVCSSVMKSADKDSLVRAHVGGGSGTSTSESRETLTTNFFVNWDEKTALTYTAARSFDVASALLGFNVSYEGQEPINLLHYLSGFEYRPHMDGSAEREGKRVATTLLYCEAADVGGATVFTHDRSSLRFQPGNGDLLFFQYAPNPSLAMHAACPVISGLKTTLTQWYRSGVSRDKYWDQFETWGRFHNPYEKSSWTGPRNDPAALAAEALKLGFMSEASIRAEL